MNANYEIKNFESNCDYNTQIIDFDGPLDLLLQLVKRAKIEIKDIFVSEVTDQFLKYLDTMEFFDIEKASEYAGFASALLYEKSKALLPRLEDEFEIEEDQGG
ncbi:MAG: segregation/condensation protein A, partial [Clostridia bacterium]|nr:segregation/condensation protein A [Clostridia bacterium]